MDKIHSDTLKTLNIEVLLRLSHLFSVAHKIETPPAECQTVLVSIFLKVDLRVFQLLRDHSSQPPLEGLLEGVGREAMTNC